jgi:pimeloyl-ACP methyl ester carboxylesterase
MMTERAMSGYAPVKGGEIYYEVAGAGPAVALVHAGICDLRMWEPQVAALAERYTIVRYDARGFGRTRSEPVAFSNRQDLADLLDHLGIGRAALVGCSRGAMIALDTALERPERVAGLGWVCGGIGGYQAPDEIFDPREIALFEAMSAAEESGDFERTADLDVRVWVDGPLQPEGRAPEHVRQAVREMTLANYRAHAHLGPAGLAPQPLDPPAAARLEELAVPVVAFLGELDPSSTALSARILAERARDVTLVRYPDAAHLPSMEHPARFNRDLLAFLDGLLRW